MNKLTHKKSQKMRVYVCSCAYSAAAVIMFCCFCLFVCFAVFFKSSVLCPGYVNNVW